MLNKVSAEELRAGLSRGFIWVCTTLICHWICPTREGNAMQLAAFSNKSRTGKICSRARVCSRDVSAVFNSRSILTIGRTEDEDRRSSDGTYHHSCIPLATSTTTTSRARLRVARPLDTTHDAQPRTHACLLDDMGDIQDWQREN